MTLEELYAVWLRRLAGRTPAAGEKRELLQAMESDPELRSRILADAEIDGLLKMMGTTEHDAEGFVKAVSDFLSAEADAGGFVGRVESRMAREGILPGKPASEADQKKLRSGFENAGNMQYNSTRASMPAIVTLEGSEEDFSHLLVHHRIVNPDQLQQALECRIAGQSAEHPHGAGDAEPQVVGHRHPHQLIRLSPPVARDLDHGADQRLVVSATGRRHATPSCAGSTRP